MQGALTVGHCGGVGNAQKTACFGCLDPDNLSLSFRFFVLVVFFDQWKIDSQTPIQIVIVFPPPSGDVQP